MNGITYYRLKSDYPGDYTKNCALNGTEVDNNFYVLEGRDILYNLFAKLKVLT